MGFAVVELVVAPGLSTAAGAAPAWHRAATLSAAGRNAQDPQIAVGGNVAVAVWQSYDGHHWRVQAARRPAGRTWSHPVTLSAAGEDAQEPQVALDRQGAAVVVWSRFDGTEDRIQAARRPAGRTWTAPVTLSAGANAWFPQVAVDRQGTTVAVWESSNSYDSWIQAARRPLGGSWSHPVTVSAAGQYAWGPHVAAGGRVAVAVWNVGDRIQAARRPVGGTWSHPVFLSLARYTARHLQVAVDRQGAAVAVWSSQHGTHYRIQAARRPAGRPWGHSVTLSAVGRVWTDHPQIALDRHGTAVAVWHSYNTNTHQERIHAVRRPAGGTWGHPVTVSAVGQPAIDPQVAISGGTVVAVWVGYVHHWQIRAARRPAGGTWDHPATLSAPVRVGAPQIAAAGRTTIAVWQRWNGSWWRIHAASLETTPRP